MSESQQPPKTDFSGILNKVKNYLTQNYVPVQNPADAAIHLTIDEIYGRLLKVFPWADYSPEEVALWLHQAGFTFYDYGLLKLEWMMNKVDDGLNVL